jgi:protein-disulfide isomerase
MTEENNNIPQEPIYYNSNSTDSFTRLKEKETKAIRKNNIFMLGVAAAVLVGYAALSVAVVSNDNKTNSVSAQESVSQETKNGLEDLTNILADPNIADNQINEQLPTLPMMDTNIENIKLPKGVNKVDGGYVYGDPNASTKVEVWADFQCPYCASFDSDAAEPLSFAEDNNAISNEYYYAAFLSPGSVRAANALGCAADQDKFREFRKFASELQMNQPGEFTDEVLINIGQEIGIKNQTKYKKCVEDGTYNDYVMFSTELMPQRGVGGTPTVFINGENVFQNGISFEEFLSRIGLNVVQENTNSEAE